MIQVCFGLHDANGRYSKFTGTTLTSIFENTSAKVAAHILHDDTLTDDNREKFFKLAERYNQHLELHNVEKFCPAEIKFLREELADKLKSRFGIGTFYRLLIKKFFDGRLIYLDSDIIVNLDIAELWQQDLRDYPLAAVPELQATSNHMRKDKFLLNAGIVRAENYFNAGVILFDLDKFNEQFFNDGLQFLIDNPQCKSLDQDILNAFFSANYLKLAQKFNAFVDTEELPAAQKIYHYAGHLMGFEMTESLKRLWMENFLKSGWLDAAAMGRLYEKFQQKDSETKNLLISLTAAMNGRRRAFVTFAEYIENIKRVFAASDDELLVIENFRDTAHLINTLKKSRRQKVFISLLENYPLLRDWLMAEGFVENRDFFDGTKFLAASHGWQISSYDFIAAL